MTEFHQACRKIDLSPQELHQLIHADDNLHRDIMSISRDITPAATSLTSAIIILGPNTIKNMALETIAKS